MQDLDNDGIDAAQEYKLGSSDTKTDTDGDGLSDSFEFFGRMPDPANPLQTLYWNVDVAGEDTVREYSSPARSDSDLDGVSDFDEFNRFVDLDTDNDGIADVFNVRQSTNPRKADSDGDGVSDFDEINGYEIKLRFPGGGPAIVTRTSDPLSPDTDGDTLPDGDEQTLGTDPTVNDADKVLDDDGDGLVNFIEDDGWDVTTFAVSTTGGVQGVTTTIHVTPSKTDKDSDDDTLSDKEEFILGTNPLLADTDGDGISDLNEVTIVNNPNGTRTITLLYNPLDADMDNDKRSEGAELNTPILVSVFGTTPYEVFSDPKKADADNDTLVDGDELFRGTDPTLFDTDGDNPGIGDAREIVLGTNPLRKDQKVTVVVSQLQLSGTEAEDGETGANDDLEIYGTINLGKTGSLVAIFTRDNTNYITMSGGTIFAINVTKSYILLEGESLTIQNSGFRDYDASSGDDPFDDASKVFNFPFGSEAGSISSSGTSGGNGSVSLVTSFTLTVEA